MPQQSPLPDLNRDASDREQSACADRVCRSAKGELLQHPKSTTTPPLG